MWNSRTYPIVGQSYSALCLCGIRIGRETT